MPETELERLFAGFRKIEALFVSLLRRYGLRPYRYRNQRRTTVTVRVTKTFAEETLCPELREVHATLREHLDAVTHRIIAEAVHRDAGDAEVRPGEGADP